MVDLHTHSSYSDGALTPAELVRRAKNLSVDALALTDHDTVEGNAEGRKAAASAKIRFYSGVELSVLCEGVSVHILGYGVEIMDEEVTATFAKLDADRRDRMRIMISRLNDQGIYISSKDVEAEAGRGVVGRLHLARVMARKRFVENTREAFSKYLARGGSAYAERPRLDAQSAVRIIEKMGGVAVLAHPGTIDREAPGVFPKVLEVLLAAGVKGIEAYYPIHSTDDTQKYLKIADENGLFPTGGSDFHRPVHTGADLGKGNGGKAIPQNVISLLDEALSKNPLRANIPTA